MVEPQSSKLITRVRFPSSAPLGKGPEIQQNEWVSGHFLISGTPTSVARLNRTPIVGLKKFRFDDRRRHYDDGFRREALELIKAGAGKGVLAGRLAIPAYTARNWIRLYRSGGEEAVMGSNGSRRYDWETKVAAARDRVEDGMTKTEVMARYGVASVTALQRWCREYRAGGAEALRPRPKGRPKGARSKPKPKPTREQELAEQVAYLKAKGKAKSETRARFEAKLAEYERLGRIPSKNSPYLRDWLERWLADITPRVKPRVLETYRSECHAIAGAIGAVRLEQLAPEHVRLMLDTLAPGRSGKTLANYRIRLRQVLAFAMREGLIQSNPVDLTEPPRVEPNDTAILAPGQPIDTIKAADVEDPDGMWRLMFRLAFATGMRQAERFALAPHVDRAAQKQDGHTLRAHRHHPLARPQDLGHRTPDPRRAIHLHPQGPSAHQPGRTPPMDQSPASGRPAIRDHPKRPPLLRYPTRRRRSQRRCPQSHYGPHQD